MPEQLQKIIDRFLEWWKKFNTKQKAILISIIAAVLLALGILAFVVSRPTMDVLVECSTTAEAGEVKNILDSDSGVKYTMSQDGLVFYVDRKDYATASILLGTNNIPTKMYDLENVFSGGFSSTEADKTKRYKKYLEEHIAEQLQSLSNVSYASVMLDVPNDDGTILSRKEEAYAAIVLTLTEEMDEEQALGLGKYIATMVGNETTDHIQILDSNSNVLFSGGDSSTSIGTASTQLSYRSKYENQVKGQVKDVLVGSSLFDHVEVGLNLDIDFDSVRKTTRNYSAPDGRENGMVYQESIYTEDASGGLAGQPGTDTNGDNSTYVLGQNEYSQSSISDQSRTYQNDETVEDRQSSGGTVNYENSSISVVATNYVIYSEDALKASGALDEMTFEEYIAANSAPTRAVVDDEYLTLIANATGVPVENISVIAQDEPIFQYSAGGRSMSDYLQIILVVLIFLLLGYVVFRTTRKEKEVAEAEPELSVESLLESTRESEEDSLEDIGYTEKSETRLLIEKFVEQNPEAAASLLRNWLNEEWE